MTGERLHIDEMRLRQLMLAGNDLATLLESEISELELSGLKAPLEVQPVLDRAAALARWYSAIFEAARNVE